MFGQVFHYHKIKQDLEGEAMDIAKQIVDQWARKMVAEHPEWFNEDNDLNKKISRAFTLLGVSSYLGIEPSEADS